MEQRCDAEKRERERREGGKQRSGCKKGKELSVGLMDAKRCFAAVCLAHLLTVISISRQQLKCF